MSIVTNWNKIKVSLENKKFVKDKYYSKKKPKNIVYKVKELKYFTTDVAPSPAEALIISALDKYKIEYLREVSFDGFITVNKGHYRFDFYIPSMKLIIEYDGKEYHKDKTNDRIKNKFCKVNNLKIIRLRDKHYYKLEKEIRSIIMNNRIH